VGWNAFTKWEDVFKEKSVISGITFHKEMPYDLGSIEIFNRIFLRLSYYMGTRPQVPPAF
jgi:hypothetical protein